SAVVSATSDSRAIPDCPVRFVAEFIRIGSRRRAGFGAYEEEGGRAAALIKRRRSWTEAAPITRPAILPSGEITSVLGKALMGMSRLNSAAITSPGSFRLG